MTRDLRAQSRMGSVWPLSAGRLNIRSIQSPKRPLPLPIRDSTRPDQVAGRFVAERDQVVERGALGQAVCGIYHVDSDDIGNPIRSSFRKRPAAGL